ncbi:MAG: amino acid adenylation domain-containing protein [Candidatus Aminicenantes bacterium]|jgi:amino acid adenylation domain-containing protein
MSLTKQEYIDELFAEQVKKKPGEIAVQDGNVQITYRDLFDKANGIAHLLLKHHIPPGEIIAVDTRSPLDMAAAILGIIKAGGVYMPVDLAQPGEYINYRLEHSQAKYLLIPSSKKNPLSFKRETLFFDGTNRPELKTDIHKPSIIKDTENPLAVIYASHSCGRARGMTLSHRKILKWIKFNVQRLKVDFSSTLFICSSRMKVSFPIWLVNLVTEKGGGVYFYEPGNESNYRELIWLMRNIMFKSVVCSLHFLQYLIQGDKYKEIFLETVDNIITLGEDNFNPGEFKQMIKERKIRWHNYFGFPGIHMITTLAKPDAGYFRHVGKPAAETSAYIFNWLKREVAIGLPGELYASGTGMMDKYHGNKDLNSLYFSEHPLKPGTEIYKSGYRASWLPDGKISLLGRTDGLVNVNGYAIALKEVETIVLKHPLVFDTAASQPIEDGYPSYLRVYLVLKEKDVSVEQLEGYLKKHLPAEVFPIGFVVLSSLPRDTDGAIDWKYLEHCEFQDTLQLKSLEEEIKKGQAVQQVAIRARELIEKPAPLHLKDYSTVINRVPGEDPDESVKPLTESQSLAAGDEGKPWAIAEGGQLDHQEGDPETIADTLKQAASQNSDKGIIYIQPDGSDYFQSYSSLQEEAEKVLAGLKKLGLKPGDKMIFQFDRNEDFVSAFWGCMLGGVVPVPITVPKSLAAPNNETATLSGVWQALDKPLVLTNKNLAQPIGKFFTDFWLETIENIRENNPDKNWHQSRPEDLAILLFTSGSTGKPKGVMQTHRSILAREKATILFNEFTSNDISLNWMPLEHVGGVVMFHIRDVCLGCNQVHARTDYILGEPFRWLELITRYQATNTWAPNFAYALLNSKLGKEVDVDWDLSSMRFILNAGEAINARSSKRFLNLLAPYGLPSTSMKPAWGMSETCSAVVYSHTFTPEPEAGVHNLDKHSLTGTTRKSAKESDNVNFVELGKPIPAFSFRIVDPNHQLVEEGVIGRIQVKGLQVTKGYYNNLEINRETFAPDGWLDTGDLGFILQGKMTITGRAKDIIIVNGINFNSVEIEAAVEEVKGVETSFTAACAVGDDDSDTEKIAIFYSSRFSDFHRQLEQIKEIQKMFVQRFGMKPDYVIPIAKEKVPKTSIGKIQRTKLKKEFEEGSFNETLKKIDIGLENDNTVPSWFFTKSWLKQPLVHHEYPDSRGNCLVFEDDTGLAEMLVTKLETLDYRCIRVRGGNAYKRTGPTDYEINHKEPEDYVRLLDELSKENTQIKDIFHLYNFCELNGNPMDLDAAHVKYAQYRGVYSLLNLVRALAGKSHPRIRFFVVTSHTQLTGDGHDVALEKCTIPAFLKSVSLELSWLRCRHIDLEAGAMPTAVQNLIREWANPREDKEVVYREGVRLVPLLVSADMKVDGPRKDTPAGVQQPWEVPLKHRGIYLVTGGLGGIGNHVCQWLIRNWQARLVIVGRTSLPPKDEWNEVLQENTPRSRRLRAYREMESVNSDFIYNAGDVADYAFLKETALQAESRWGESLSGVFHLAGYLPGDTRPETRWAVMDNHWAAAETRQTFENMFQSKVYGTMALHRLFKDDPRAIFVAFSSTIAFFGAGRFSAYAAANGFLDSFCLLRHARGYPNTYCINWSSWNEVGMSANTPTHIVKAMETSGYEMIAPKKGLHSMRIALGSPYNQLFVGLDGTRDNIRHHLREYPPEKQVLYVYYTIKSGEKFSPPGGDQLGKKLIMQWHQLNEMPLYQGQIDYKRLAELDTDSRHSRLESDLPRSRGEKILAAIWEEVLGKDQVGLKDNFFEIGGQSLKATLLAAKIHKAFDVNVALKEIFSHPTIGELSAYLEEASRGDKYVPINPVEMKEYYVVSSSQKRLYVLQQLDKDNIGYNMPSILQLEGKLNPERLEESFNRLIRRHEGLRTSFEMIHRHPRQRVHRQVEFSLCYNEIKEPCITDIAKDFIHSFDLSRAPLLRVSLIKMEEEKHLLLMDMHHIIFDGISQGIFIKDFMGLYRGGEFFTLEIQYKDFSQWQNLGMTSDIMKKQESYWVEQLAGEIPELELPYDYPRPGVFTFEGKKLEFELDRENTATLKEMALKEDVTLFMLLIAICNVLFSRLSGQEDIIIGTPIAGRRHAELQDIIGIFLNTLVLRNQPRQDKPFREFLKEVKKNTLKAYENQDYPFEELVEKVVKKRNTSRNPLFDVIVVLQNMENPEVNIPGLKLKSYAFDPGISRWDFGFTATEEGGGIRFSGEYNTRLFKPETIERFIGYLKELFKNIPFFIDKAIGKINIITEAERRQLLYDFNDTSAGYPRNKVLHQLFEEQVERTSDGIAILYNEPAAGSKKERLTYQQLNEKSNRLARVLRDKGVIPGTLVPMLMEPSLDMMVAILAVLKAGGAYLPIDPKAPGNRVKSILADSAASLVLTTSGTVDMFPFTSLQTGIGEKGVGEVKVSPPRPPIADFDALPIPDRALVNYEKYNRYIGQAMVSDSVALQASRGCPYYCAYCHKLWPKSHVYRSAEHIFKEVHMYYQLGVRRFVFIDDIFNLNWENSRKFFHMVINKGIDIHIFFPNGFRGDLLSKEDIDLMVKAGTVNIAMALETASPRLQKLIKKNLNLKKFRENIQYICETYPDVILELFTMHGFPTETREEAQMTLDFINSMKWLHFPYVHILKIYPNTDMERLALESGISRQAIENSMDLAFHELPETLPFDKSFTASYQARFLEDYFLNKERLLQVLPYQQAVLTEDEMMQKYNSYLPVDIKRFDDLLRYAGISREELPAREFLPGDAVLVPNLNEKYQQCFPTKKADEDALKVLLLDLSQFFTDESNVLYSLIEPPLGLMYLLTYLNRQLGSRIKGKIAKSKIDFANYKELNMLLREFKPDIIGIRTLSYYRHFFHKTVQMIRQWGITVPIVTGGPYATSAYETILQDTNVDLVVLGEGEVTFTELIGRIIENNKKLPAEKELAVIPGIAYNARRQAGGVFQKSGREILMVDELQDLLREAPGENLEPLHQRRYNHPDELAYIIFTSGSTGKPKGVMVEHGNVVRLMINDKNLFDFNAHDVWTLFHSYSFDFSVWEMYGALLYGGKLVLVPPPVTRDPGQFLKLLTKEKVTILNQTPSAFYSLSREALESPENDLNRLRYVIFGGEALSPGKLKEWKSRYPWIQLINMYGITETTIHVTYKEIEAADIRLNISNIGTPIPTLTVYIVTPDLGLAPLGVAGELCVGGDGVSRGYLNRPELTAEMFPTVNNRSYKSYMSYFSKKFYKSGDLARWMAKGEIQYLGRIDQQVKIRGYRIELEEIESHLLAYDEIKEAVVVTRKRKDGDKYLCAYITVVSHPAHESTPLLEVSEVKKHLSGHLPDYMIPTYFVPVKNIPLTANGKVDLKALPGPEESISDDAYMAPYSEIERKLLAVWSEVLEIDPGKIGVNSDFFGLGGHSLKATYLASRVHKEFHVKVPLLEIFRRTTIRELALAIKESWYDRYAAIGSVEGKEFYTLSPAQKRLYILHRLLPGSLAYNIPIVVALAGKLERKQMEKAFKTLIRRHESLRTSFHMLRDKPAQRVHDQVDFRIEYYDMKQVEVKVEEKHLEGTRGLAPLLNTFIRPFDLSRAPLLRVGLIMEGEQKHVLMVDMHHIISDGASMELFIKEMTALYVGEELPVLRVQYKDFAVWQSGQEQEEQIKGQQDYWLHVFDGEIPVLYLPVDYARPEKPRFEGDGVDFEIPAQQTQSLKELGFESGATLYMVLLTVTNIFLSKLSNQKDIIIGSPTAGRRHMDLERIIGIFINTLAFRNYPQGDMTVRDFLKEVKQTTLEAFENQEYPFEDLVDRVQVNRDISRNPLFDFMLVLQNIDTPSRETPFAAINQLRVKPYKNPHKTAKFDLELSVWESSDRLGCQFKYSTELFKRTTIKRFISYFQQILDEVLRDPGKKLSEIDILTYEEKSQLLLDFSGIGQEAQFPRGKPLQQLFREQVRRTPDNRAAVSRVQEIGEKQVSITYQELEEKSSQMAHLLRQKGVRADTIVGIAAEPSLEMILGIMAILKAGGAYLPIDPGYPAERIAYMLADSGAQLLITTHKLKAVDRKPGKWKGETIFISSSLFSDYPSNSSLCCLSRSSSLVYVIYTSGTTGKPKGVMLTHQSLVNYVNWFTQNIRLTEEDKTVLTSSFAFDLGYTSIFPPIVRGGELHLLSRIVYLSGDRLLKSIEQEGITYIKVTPALLTVMVNSNSFSPEKCRSIRLVVVGGESIHLKEIKKVNERCPHIEIMNHYGPTEATIGSVAQLIDFHRFEEYEGNSTIGRPIDNASVLILDRYLKLLPVGVPGELCISGICLARGYLNHPELTLEKFILAHSSWLIADRKVMKRDDKFPMNYELSAISYIYKTGDLARWLWNGNIEFLGRIDFQVKIRGFRIELSEIENCLLRHEKVKNAVVIDRDTTLGETDRYLCAYMVSTASAATLSDEELIEYLSHTLPDYMIPSFFVWLESIPLTPNGKVNRKALPEPRKKADKCYLAPRDEIEERLAGIWANLLGLRKDIIGIEDGFFHLGGHSLKATIMSTKIYKEFNIPISLEDIFKTPTIRGIASLIKTVERMNTKNPDMVRESEEMIL